MRHGARASRMRQARHRHSRSAGPRSSAEAAHRRNRPCLPRSSDSRRNPRGRPRCCAPGRARRTCRRESFRAVVRSRDGASDSSSFSGSKSMKPAISSRSNFRRAGELPQNRAKLRPERGEALGEEIADAFGAFAKPRAHDAKARALDRELESVGRNPPPILPAFWALPAIECRVDLDRAEVRATRIRARCDWASSSG